MKPKTLVFVYTPENGSPQRNVGSMIQTDDGYKVGYVSARFSRHTPEDAIIKTRVRKDQTVLNAVEVI